MYMRANDARDVTGNTKPATCTVFSSPSCYCSHAVRRIFLYPFFRLRRLLLLLLLAHLRYLCSIISRFIIMNGDELGLRGLLQLIATSFNDKPFISFLPSNELKKNVFLR